MQITLREVCELHPLEQGLTDLVTYLQLAGEGFEATVDETVVEILRVFLPESSNEARVVERIDTHLNRIADLGFLRRMRAAAGAGAQTTFEVRRILKAFVDAEWLAELDARLAAYRAELDGREEADRARE